MNERNTMEYDEENEKRSPKGFYIALALCVLAIVGVALILFVDTDDVPLDDTPMTTTTVGTTVTTTDQAVAGVVTGVPDTRTTTVVTTQPTEKQPLFVLPASNVILREYSDTMMYSETLGEWRTHNGVDFEVKADTGIKAIADGTISKIETDALWGDVVVIDHGDKLVSRYCGVTASGVQEGQAVTAGEIIGSVSDIPCEIVDARHVHIEVLANGKYVDPMTLIALN